MRDSRIDDYARLLVDRSVGVKPGWDVVIRSTRSVALIGGFCRSRVDGRCRAPGGSSASEPGAGRGGA